MASFPTSKESKLDLSDSCTGFGGYEANETPGAGKINGDPSYAKKGTGGDTSSQASFKASKKTQFGDFQFGNETDAGKSGNGADTSFQSTMDSTHYKGRGFGNNPMPNESDYAKKGTGA